MDKFLSPAEVSEYIGVPVQTLYTWNAKGTGPAYSRVGKHIRYRLSTLDKWMEARESDAAAAR